MQYKAIIFSLNSTYELTWNYGTTNPNITIGQQNLQLGNFENTFEVRKIVTTLNLTVYHLMPMPIN